MQQTIDKPRQLNRRTSNKNVEGEGELPGAARIDERDERQLYKLKRPSSWQRGESKHEK